MSTATGESCLCAALRRASRSVTRTYDEALAPVGLTVMQFSTLRTIQRLRAPTLSGLAAAMDIERSAVWRKLQPLVREGLLAAGAGPARAQTLSLTDQGHALLERATPLWRTAQAEIRDELAEDEATLLHLLRKVQTA